MDVTTKLITYATVSNSGTFAGRPYDLYKQVRYVIIRLLTIHSPEFHRVPLHRLKNPHGSLSPWINWTRCRKAKRPIE